MPLMFIAIKSTQFIGLHWIIEIKIMITVWCNVILEPNRGRVTARRSIHILI